MSKSPIVAREMARRQVIDAAGALPFAEMIGALRLNGHAIAAQALVDLERTVGAFQAAEKTLQAYALLAADNPMVRVSLVLQDIARELDDRIAGVAGVRTPFSLFVWTRPRCSYIATCDRDAVIATLETMIAGWKNGMPDVPAHQVS